MGRRHEESYVRLGLNIAYYRKRARMTQEELAGAVVVSRTHISNIETAGMGVSPSLELLFGIARVLGVRVSALFESR